LLLSSSDLELIVAEDDSSEPPHLTNMKRKRTRQLSKPSHNAERERHLSDKLGRKLNGLE
jgi:hypothetical protein